MLHARQARQVESRRVGREVGELGPAACQAGEQPLECAEVGAALELGVQREHLVAPPRAGAVSASR